MGKILNDSVLHTRARRREECAQAIGSPYITAVPIERHTENAAVTYRIGALLLEAAWHTTVVAR